MLVWVKQFTLKRFVLIGLFVLGAILMEFHGPTIDTAGLQESRFLGIGTKTERGPCVMGVRYVYQEFTIFWIIRIKSPIDQWWPEPCE